MVMSTTVLLLQSTGLLLVDTVFNNHSKVVLVPVALVVAIFILQNIMVAVACSLSIMHSIAESNTWYCTSRSKEEIAQSYLDLLLAGHSPPPAAFFLGIASSSNTSMTPAPHWALPWSPRRPRETRVAVRVPLPPSLPSSRFEPRRVGAISRSGRGGGGKIGEVGRSNPNSRGGERRARNQRLGRKSGRLISIWKSKKVWWIKVQKSSRELYSRENN
jgi:hypothetical protein